MGSVFWDETRFDLYGVIPNDRMRSTTDPADRFVDLFEELS